MNGSSAQDRFGFGDGRGFPLAGGVWEAMESLRTAFEPRGNAQSTRMGKGDVRHAVLTLLAEEPMHGYQIIQEIERRSDGTWKPSPGSVYPTLQMLADEDLISVSEANGKKTYELTDAGRAEIAATEDRSAPWEGSRKRETRAGALPKASAHLAQAAAAVMHSGNMDQVERAAAVLDEARRSLYAILAED